MAKRPVPIPPGARVVGVNGVAELLGVTPARVSVWRNRGLLLEPRWHLAERQPAWDAADVLEWRKRDGRRLIELEHAGRPVGR